jgi:C4-dicarboxylate-specific signal transduction histidine kinase
MMGELATTLAHQLNQPLMAIAANVAAGRRMLQPDTPRATELGAILEDVGEANRRASEVIRRVRDLLRKDPPEHGAVDLGAVLTSVTRLIRAEADRRRVHVSVSIANQPLVVRGDAVQLQQVFLNLLLNALEAIGDDRLERFVVVTAGHLDDAAVAVRVEDSGPGFAFNGQAPVFEPFYTTKSSGLGMGLPIARSIVEDHGGSIVTGTAAAGGAVVSVTLPPARSATPAQAAAHAGSDH